jgi:ferredoxin/flavodoxin---NADP+ reductase
MYTIKSNELIAKDTVRLVVEAPVIARKAQAGQFVVVVSDERAERIPLTLSDWDADAGTITLIFQVVGASTKRLAAFSSGAVLLHVLGPMGHPTEIKRLATVVCIGGGVGIAEVYPVSRAFKNAGNRVMAIIGARSKEHIILEQEMQRVSDELWVRTDDGSYGKKGFVTDALRELLETIEKSTHTIYPALVYAIGPVPMMKAVAELTKEYNIKTIVSLNPIMVDATGMCGSCRCTVGGKSVFGCVDGPDFDAHQVDFEELAQRLAFFKAQEAFAKNLSKGG